MREFDFVIFCAARVGAHMLASMLNSHPDIACEGEIQLPRDRVTQRAAKKKARLRGCILHYGLKRRATAPKIIHLTRTIERAALSLARARMVEEDGRYGPHKWHCEKGEKPINHLIKPDPADMTRIAAKMVIEREQAVRYLKRLRKRAGASILTVKYERITGNQSVETMPEELGEKILGFLGLSNHPLRTYFIKGG